MKRNLRLYLDGSLLPVSCRLHLHGRNEMTLSPTLFQLDLFQTSENTVALLSAGHKLAVCSTGESLLAIGDILDVLTDTVNGIRITSVIFSDGYSFSHCFASGSFPASTSLKEITSALLSGCSVPKPIAGFTASDKIYPSGTTFFGNITDILATIATDLNADVFLFRSAVYFLDRDKPPDIIDLNDEDITDEVSMGKDEIILSTAMKGWPIGSVLRYGGVQGQIVCQWFDADTGTGVWQSRVIARRAKL